MSGGMMRLRKAMAVVTGIALVFCVWARAQESFSGKQALGYIEELCKEQYAGRKTGVRGAREAALWIGEQFAEWGLEPGGDGGTYIQQYGQLVTRQIRPAVLVLENGLFGETVYQEGNDFVVYFNSGSGTYNGEVIFAGFGISEPEKGWDDYAGLDVQGKAVLIHRGRPEDGQDWSEENQRHYKMNTAARHGAAAVLIYEGREWAVRGATIREKGYQPGIPVLSLSRKCARDFFQGSYRNMDYVLRDLKKNPQSFSTGKIVCIDVGMERVEPGIGENVVGILPGSDPILRHEVMVVGGHMDHNGVSADGHLYAGADDNASGTAVVMELARVLASRSGTLRRTMVFAAFGGEEQGLLGSTYFAGHPPVNPESICLMFNFDMEGTGDGGGGFGGRNYFPEIVDEIVDVLSDTIRKKLRISRGWGVGGSDHAPFIQKGIPAFGFFSTGGHPFYHRVEDRPRTLNSESLHFVGNRAAEILEALAGWDGSLLFQGNKQGRCFLLLGDQMDLHLNSGRRVRMEDEDTGALSGQYGLRVRSVSLNDFVPEKAGPMDLVRGVDTFLQWADSGKGRSVFSPAVFNQAAAGGETGVILGMEGTASLGNDTALFRSLARLGLGMLLLKEVDDPVFAERGVSDFGKSVMQTCRKEKIALLLELEDADLVEKAARMAGTVLIRWPGLEDREDLPDGLLQMKEAFWVVACRPETRAQALSDFMDRTGSEKCHFSVIPLPDDSGKSGQAVHLKRMYSLIQDLYILRREKQGEEKAYEEMVRILGGNLKRLFH
jgi:hypothetical protein